VTDVQVFSGYVLHIGVLTEGELSVGDEVVCTYDEVRFLFPSFPFLSSNSANQNGRAYVLGFTCFCGRVQSRRSPLRKNHTATHILNYALREVLGSHIDQKGSLVAPSKLRFDFSHKGPISFDELFKIEKIVADWIERNVGVFSKELPLEMAQKIPGLRAVFGEAYPDPVRVVTLEFDVEEMAKDIENPKWRETSVEFCGGT
jgi:alanyl-tRNA synthetase